MSETTQIDERDLKIVRLLQENAWRTHAEIGELIHLSPSAVQRRIERLRERGVITGAQARIDWSVLTNQTRMYFVIELVNDGAAALRQITEELKANPEVIEIDLVAGRFDLVVMVDTANTETFFDFAMKTLNDNENVRHCWSLTRLKKFA